MVDKFTRTGEAAGGILAGYLLVQYLAGASVSGGSGGGGPPPGPGPGAVTFNFFTAGRSSCQSNWTNGTSAAIQATCWVVVKNSQSQSVSLGTASFTMQAGESIGFQVSLSPTLSPGTYEFSTFIVNQYGEPVSTTHTETDTV